MQMIHFDCFSQPRMVYEDKDYLVVSKPAGLHCVAGSDQLEEPCLANWMASRYPELLQVQGFSQREYGLAHRLDAATSGLVVFARNTASFENLRLAATSGLFSKEYVLLASPQSGGLAGSRPLLQSPQGHTPETWQRLLRHEDGNALAAGLGTARIDSLFRAYGPGRRQVACAALPLPAGKAADRWGKTIYRTEVLEAIGIGAYAMLPDGSIRVDVATTASSKGSATDSATLFCRVRLTRGFRHQIRAHFAWLGLPLLGDRLYGEADDTSSARLCLHAAALRLPLAEHQKFLELTDSNFGFPVTGSKA